MSQTTTTAFKKTKLQVLGQPPASGGKLQEFDMDAELKRFEEEERERLGMAGAPDQWIEDMANLDFKKRDKANITLLVGGLTLAQDFLAKGALKGIGYNVGVLECPTNEGLRYGKEFGNRGQCNPTYFTVGNLVKYLCTLRDVHGMSAKEIVDSYVFVTAGACGPCRFGMYVTEYRKALRDAGFEGFRVMLFQQQGGLKQATGEESGLELNPTFFWALVKAIVAGDVLNAIGYRLRPFEVEPGATDRAMDSAKAVLYESLESGSNFLVALAKTKKFFKAVKVNRLQPKPKVSIIGEFWAMTTEGDGNYQLQRFMEGEGAENDIQLTTAWLLYNLWEVRHDTKGRADLKAGDTSKYGLGKDVGPFDAAKRLAMMNLGDTAVRTLFQTFAHAVGLYGYHLPDMDMVAEVAAEHYNNDLRGGEGHMEVGKLIVNVVNNKAHMTLSVKPFGCMPSAGVSDGVQSLITEKYPGTIFCPVETSGDGRVNFYSRVQMYLFKARQAASAELDRALSERGVTLEEVQAFLDANPKYASPLHKSPHAYAGTGADLVAEVYPLMGLSKTERVIASGKGIVTSLFDVMKKSPKAARGFAEKTVAAAPVLVSRMKEDVASFKDARANAKKKAHESTLSAAAE